MTTTNDLFKPGLATDFFTRCDFSPFDPGASTYSAVNARWLAELSRLVYRNGDRTEFLARRGLTQVGDPFDDGNTQAFLVRAPNIFAALVFRGTDDLKAWLTNLQAWETPLGGGIAVHKGFEDAFKPVWPKIEKALDGVDEPVFFSGHSLGAALATIAAQKRAPRALYTFGSPYVGNRAFVDSLSGVPIYRVDDGHDIVPTMPLPELGYAHAGELHALHAKKEIFKYDSLEKFWEFVELPPPLADHAPINYVTRI